MATIRRFEDILAWQKARGLVREVHRVCRAGTLRRDFVLRDQLSRAALSSMTNVAEGFGRGTRKDFARFLDVSRGSTAEVQSLLYVAVDEQHVGEEDFRKLYGLADEVAALTTAFISYLRSRRKGTAPRARRTQNAELRTQNS